MEELESLSYMILHGEGMILDDGAWSARKLRGGKSGFVCS